MKNAKKLKMHKLLSMILFFTGLILMSGKIYADSEPGAIPLLLICIGAGWYFITRYRIRTQHI